MKLDNFGRSAKLYAFGVRGETNQGGTGKIILCSYRL